LRSSSCCGRLTGAALGWAGGYSKEPPSTEIYTKLVMEASKVRATPPSFVLLCFLRKKRRLSKARDKQTKKETQTKRAGRFAQNYGPNLDVFMACGPMSEVYCKPIEQVIQTVKAHGVKAHFLDQVQCLPKQATTPAANVVSSTIY